MTVPFTVIGENASLRTSVDDSASRASPVLAASPGCDEVSVDASTSGVTDASLASGALGASFASGGGAKPFASPATSMVERIDASASFAGAAVASASPPY